MDWGGFRPAYHRLCFIRPLLQHATFLALSATLTPAMVTELKRLLGLYDVDIIRRSNDRLNIAPIVKRMKYTLQSLHDLAFLIPHTLTTLSSPPRKFMLFMHSKKMCQQAGIFLRARLAPELRNRVVWVHSEMTSGFNERAMEKLRNGELYGIVCTDVAGMVSILTIFFSRAKLIFLCIGYRHPRCRIGCTVSVTQQILHTLSAVWSSRSESSQNGQFCPSN
jgi:superfamily II DNA helicase RecQ